MAEIEYVNETHQYLLDGVIIPSVSKLTAYALNEDFSNIPADVLEKASNFGTEIHGRIELYERMGIETDDDYFTIQNWKRIKEEYKIQVIDTEQIVYTDEYAGRYDILAFVDDEISLIDIKTNRNYPKDHLECQLGFYKNAKQEVQKCYCLWLDKPKKEWHFRKVDEYKPDLVNQIVFGFKNGLPSPVNVFQMVNINAYTPVELSKIKQFYALKKEIEIIEQNIKDNAVQYMEENDMDVWEDENFRVKYTAPRTDKTVDTEKLKADGLYQKYLKDKPVSASVRITQKWQKA